MMKKALGYVGVAAIGAAAALGVQALPSESKTARYAVHPCKLENPKPSFVALRGKIGEASITWEGPLGEETASVNCEPVNSLSEVWPRCAPIWREKFCKR